MVVKNALRVLFIGIINLSMAQFSLTIDDTHTIEEAVTQSLTSEYYTISNITAEINIDEDRLQSGDLLPSFGTYSDPISYFGLNKGLILTNGAAKFAEGPNNSPNKDQVNTNFSSSESITDAHMNYVLRTIGSTFGGATDSSPYDFDAILLEFDIVSTRSEIAFEYIFATEEYPYPSASAKIDPIAIFISGPGVVGEYLDYLNIATYKGSIITPELINHANNSEVYNSNGTGASPFIDFYTQYDGYTNKLRASTTVVPCETYHVKMMVIDEDWNLCDAALMVQPAVPVGNDLPQMSIAYDDDRFPYGIEGCNHATLRIERSGVDAQNMGNAIVY